ncbi:energy transducer TonB [Chondromyces apiculatus]|uniref:Protein TonB n=1 Tax=Chondromyces apiculatus DSM 436 TaxID=1192034 RepID=A0A017T2E1_9BACT|nr:energy transducer TonB [Chondromyces apiculatus]EYF02716.1 Hypothetical protein CAP_6606 [Chondromyces apiculatus DSM 436]
MFDAVLNRAAVPRGRLGTGTVIAVATHAALLAFALHAARRDPEPETAPPEVTFYVPPPPPPPPLGGATRTATKPQPQRPRVRPDRAVIPPPNLPPTPPEPPAVDEPAVDEGDPQGDPYGEPGGVPGGIPGGTPGGTGTALTPRPAPPPPPPKPSYQVIPFGSGMERPVLLSGATPAYPPEARAARVEGSVLVQCTITTSGEARDCRILKGLPYLDDAVLRAVATHRYRPMYFNGRPENVRYVFTFRFRRE